MAQTHAHEPEFVAALARAAYQAINDHDIETFISLIDPEVEFGSLIAEVEGQQYFGHEGIRRWWSEIIESLTDLQFEPVAIHPFGDQGYTQLRITTRTGGVEVPQQMFQAFRLRESKPYWWKTFRTEAEAREALGLEPS